MPVPCGDEVPLMVAGGGFGKVVAEVLMLGIVGVLVGCVPAPLPGATGIGPVVTGGTTVVGRDGVG
ncbi:MAG: hypothetical protein LC737_08390, partial [Chloroflexi bacterium]|nr:hypothetical protein [Chloroflexota bacterium]